MYNLVKLWLFTSKDITLFIQYFYFFLKKTLWQFPLLYSHFFWFLSVTLTAASRDVKQTSVERNTLFSSGCFPLVLYSSKIVASCGHASLTHCSRLLIFTRPKSWTLTPEGFYVLLNPSLLSSPETGSWWYFLLWEAWCPAPIGPLVPPLTLDVWGSLCILL